MLRKGRESIRTQKISSRMPAVSLRRCLNAVITLNNWLGFTAIETRQDGSLHESNLYIINALVNLALTIYSMGWNVVQFFKGLSIIMYSNSIMFIYTDFLDVVMSFIQYLSVIANGILQKRSTVLVILALEDLDDSITCATGIRINYGIVKKGINCVLWTHSTFIAVLLAYFFVRTFRNGLMSVEEFAQNIMFISIMYTSNIYFLLCIAISHALQVQCSTLLKFFSGNKKPVNNTTIILYLTVIGKFYPFIILFNKCFGLPLLLVIMLTFVKGFLAIFYSAQSIILSAYINGFEDLGPFFLISYGVWVGFIVLWMLVIVAILSSTIDKANETALCTRHFDDYSMKNTKITKQINKFLLKNLHQKKKFSAYGFFDIDNSVIYTVFSSIITYLVILIQFKQLENDLTQGGKTGNVTEG